MRRNKFHIALAALGAFLLLAAAAPQLPELVQLRYPASWPAPKYDFAASPLTQNGIALGRKLFYDPILSVDSTISCGSCHLSYTAFTHVDHALSHGVRDSIGTRNSPALMNLAWSTSFMWDGAVNHLDMQALAPISHPAEMAEDIAHVVAKLNRSPVYPDLFRAAFAGQEVTGAHLLKALAQFQLTLVSADSKYDQVMRQEAGVEFSEQEQQGYQLYQKHCASCHPEPLFTTGEFASNGLPVDTTLNDWGRMNISLNPADSLKFKIPTLRNIEFSFPYMHDGRFKKLSQVMKHYTDGIQPHPSLAPELQGGLPLSETDKVDLITFLLTLSDKKFLLNPDFGFPR